VGHSKTALQGTPEHYRARAAEMLKKAQEAETDTARNAFLLLATSWDNLAQHIEHPTS
jgi:hypothetical protein